MAQDYQQLVESQRDFFRSGKTLDINFRIEKLKKLKEIIKKNNHKIVEAISNYFGKSEFETFVSETMPVMDEIDIAISKLHSWAKPIKVKTPLTFFKAESRVYYQPLGTVLVIGAWNYPLLLGLVRMIGAIAAGNAQPLLDIIGETFSIDEAELGIVVTISQIGYGLGLFLLVPLSDLADNRKLIIYQFILLALFLMAVSFASSFIVLLAGMFLVGSMAVVTQSMVAYAASMSTDQKRGQVVGTVTSGVVVGLLLARTVAGTLTQFTGWRSVYLISAIISLILSLIFFLVLPRP